MQKDKAKNRAIWRIGQKVLLAVLVIWLTLAPRYVQDGPVSDTVSVGPVSADSAAALPADEAELPVFQGEPFAFMEDNVPDFTEQEKAADVFETYSPLDEYGRCGAAYANLCAELMPTEKRESISDVYPSGWKYAGASNNHKYDSDLVDGGYLYNRCHLIGFQLAGENANELNLITGTRYLNVEGMLPFENMVADYIKETSHHVLYRVTPCYVGGELVARGVRIEAWSIEDDGDGICFDVYCFNVQPGIEIDYLTGQNCLADELDAAA